MRIIRVSRRKKPNEVSNSTLCIVFKLEKTTGKVCTVR